MTESSPAASRPESATRVEKAVDRMGAFIADNAERFWVVLGFLNLYLCGVTLLADAYPTAVFCGFIGWQLLGGWPALVRFVRHPVFQARHWFHILRDTRKISYREYPDGTTRVVIMRPTRRNGWGWVQVGY